MTIHGMEASKATLRSGGLLKAIVYTSRVAHHIKDDAALLEVLLKKSATANSKRDVSGAMLLVNRQFLQIIEGAEQTVNSLFADIVADSRHADIVVLYSSPIEYRNFSEWSMVGLHIEDPEQFDEQALSNIKSAFDRSFAYNGTVFLQILKSVFSQPEKLERIRKAA